MNYFQNEKWLQNEILRLSNLGIENDTVTIVNQGTDSRTMLDERETHDSFIKTKEEEGWQKHGNILQIKEQTFVQLLIKNNKSTVT